MTDRKLKAYVIEHPYLLDDSFVMTTSEAQAIIDSAEHVLTFEEMIAGAKKRFPQYSAEQWIEFDQSIAKRRNSMSHKQVREKHRQRYGKHWKVAIASFIIAIIMFFTLVPAGRALAQELYQYVVQIWKNYAAISQQHPSDAEGTPGSDANDSSVTYDESTVLYTSLEAFERETGLTPFVLDADWLKIERIEARYDPDFGQKLWINYLNVNGAWIRTTETWLSGQDVHAWTDDEAYTEVDVGNGRKLYYGIDPDDHSFGGIMLLDSSLLLIGADSRIDVQMLIDQINAQASLLASASN